jgi:hypothetical protein
MNRYGRFWQPYGFACHPLSLVPCSLFLSTVGGIDFFQPSNCLNFLATKLFVMRTAALLLLLVAFSAANAQRFSLLPQVGLEDSKTKVIHNDGNSFAPAGVKFSPQGSLQLNYSSKKGHGFFIGAATSRSTVVFSFADPEAAATNFIANTGNMQVRFEGGYRFTTKPISLNRSAQTAPKSAASKTKTKKQCSYSTESRCTKSYTASFARCGSKSKQSKEQLAKEPAKIKNTGSWMRIQPMVGMGFIPSVRPDVVSKFQGGQTSYEYRAGNWNTAVIAGAGFEFGKNNARLFTVSINYFKGLGNLNSQTITRMAGTKMVTTTLQSEVSGWNLRVGIPFTLGGSKPAVKKVMEKKPQQRSGCGSYRPVYRCNQ